MSKIRYIEASPIKQVLEFETREEYNIFFNTRIKEIIDYTYSNNLKYQEYYIYKRVMLNKDGTPRKEIDPTWLHSKKSSKKQKENFAIYCEKRKKQTLKAGFRRRLAEMDFKIEYWTKQKQELSKEYQDWLNN